MPRYIRVNCSCGRGLRARPEMEDSTIRCWSCHAEVPVPSLSAVRLARESAEVARGVFEDATLGLLLLGALTATVLLAVPGVGGWLAILVLGAAGMRYRMVLRRSGRHNACDRPEAVPRDVPTLVREWALGLAVGAGLIAPFLLRHAILGRGGRAAMTGGVAVWALAAVAWVGVPLAVLATSACDKVGPIGARRALDVLRRHPVAAVVALLLVPAVLSILELVLVFFTIRIGWFRYLVWDLFPTSGIEIFRPEYRNFSAVSPVLPASIFVRDYVAGLRRGYTLIGAIPASLPLGLRTWLAMPSPNRLMWMFWAVRVALTATIFSVVGPVLAIQARWLGLIPTVESRRGRVQAVVEAQ